jgi:hypothetical protein
MLWKAMGAVSRADDGAIGGWGPGWGEMGVMGIE